MMGEARFRRLMVLSVALLGAAAYVNTFQNDWVWDDVSSVLLHEHVQDPSKIFQLFKEDQHKFGRGTGNFYRPLVSVSFMADFLLSYDAVRDGVDANGRPNIQPLLFHAGNMFWHIFAALLLFAVLTRLGAPQFARVAATIIFVVHPLQTEAVTYISGRADMMAAAFMFAGLWFALGDGGRRIGAWVGSGCCFCLALLCKESAMIFPVLLLVLQALRPLGETEMSAPRTAYKLRAVPVGIAALLLVFYGILRSTVLHFADASAGAGASLGQRLIETAQAFAFYIHMLLAPSGLHMEQTLANTPGWTAAAGALLLLAVVLAFALALWRGHRRLAMGVAWFVATWLPISGIFPLNAPMAEHWMYVPLAGFWWAIAEALLLDRCCERWAPFARCAAVACLAIVFLSVTVARNREWRDNETLYRATLRENPDSRRIHYNLAVVYEDLQGNYPGAKRHFEAFLALGSGGGALRTDEIDVHLSLGHIAMEMEDYNEAVRQFGMLMALQGNDSFKQEYALGLLGLGHALLMQGQLQSAYGILQQAMSEAPAIAPRAQAILSGAV